MMTTTTIRGIPVNFPFKPYEIQVNYMEKVIECLQDHQNGVLESPTGTGKTLSLLCASLAWLEVKKAQVQAHRLTMSESNDFLKELNSVAGGQSTRGFLGMPTIIYASRTHTQLSQAMQELKRTSYNHLKATVLGSREQMCVNQEVLNERNNAMKVHLCRMKVKERSCFYYNKVERKKDDPAITQLNVIDIEDLVKLGQQHKFCPYYMAKELKQNADIVFTPYNYLLDPKTRRALGLELAGNVVILDEGHNIEKICEDSASIQIKSSDITLCIEEVTHVMKAISEDIVVSFNDKEVPKDFTADELCMLKEIFLNFEKVVDEIEVKGSSPEGTHFEGNYIFQMLEKAGITDANYNAVTNLMDKVIQFLATVNEGPFARRGVGLQLFSDMLTVAYASVNPQFKQKIKKCYKVHLAVEEGKKKTGGDWLSKATSKSKGRVLSLWCFSPGFGMNTLVDQGVHCVILTSGTLAPLKPLISELELDVGVRIENPHIVKGDQVCVKILTKGPDSEVLNCNYQNRDNPKYLMSLGQVIMNLIRVIPHGVLIFFPSYPIMQKCQEHWQQSGLWDGIYKIKPIFAEPKDKTAFTCAMTEYYSKIKDPVHKGAIFMGVCRGKVSEGLDFADMNGRAVFIIGLPYPPLKDPKIILKKRYLDVCNAQDKQYLKGDEWYSLEATRAINQAIGRVIRHQNDYGAIILLDSRFTNPRIQSNLSMWLRQHIKIMPNFGMTIRDIRAFFQNAQAKVPAPVDNTIKDENTPSVTRAGNFDFSTSSITLTSSTSSGLVNIHKRKATSAANVAKKKKIVVVANPDNSTSLEASIAEFITMVKKALSPELFKLFIGAMTVYKTNFNLEELKKILDQIFLTRHHLRYIIRGLEPFIKEEQKTEFGEYCDIMQGFCDVKS